MNRSTLIIALAAVSAFVAGAYFAIRGQTAAEFSVATVFETPRSLPAVELIDDRGMAVEPGRFTGRWDILFFGFTHCPDICPATLFQLKGLRAQLQSLDKDSQPRIWLVSVDPARDTPETLNRYLAHFGEGFTGITGNDDEIARLAASLGVAYQRIDEGEDYTMSHSAALFVLDPQGHFVALFSAPHEMTAIADDYRLLSR